MSSTFDPPAPSIGPWEYTYHPPVHLSQGEVAKSMEHSTEWKPAPSTVNPPGRQPDAELWLRTRLTVHDPANAAGHALIIPVVDQAVQVFAGEKLIYSFGSIQENGRFHFSGYPIHKVDLRQAGESRDLYFRLLSDHTNIGIGGQVQVENPEIYLRQLVIKEIPSIGMSFVLVLLGIFVFPLFLQNRKDRSLLVYSLFVACLGVFVAASSDLARYLCSWTIPRTCLEAVSMYASALLAVAYCDAVFFLPRGARWLRKFVLIPYAIFTMSILLLSVFDVVGLFRQLPFWQIATIVSFLLALPYRQAIRRDREAGLMALGVLACGLCGIASIMSANNLLPRPLGSVVMLFGISALAGSMGLMIVLRYREMNRQVKLFAEEVKEKNEQLQRLDKLKDEFLANTSHELRTPLVGILGIVESILDGAAGAVSDDLSRNLRLVVQSGRRLSTLINDVLDFSRIRERQIEIEPIPTDLRQAVDLALAIAQVLVQQKPLLLQNAVPTNLPTVLADPSRLQQVLSNLIGNGIKFSTEGTITVTAVEKETTIEICVSDSGIGIEKEKWETIFQAFEQGDASTSRHHGGTGLGLAISKSLVELMGGRIWLHSALGAGSQFYFTLPKSDKPPKEEETDLSFMNRRISNTELVDESLPGGVNLGAAPLGEQGKVLVVDDEEINRQVLANILTNRGYQVASVCDGPAATKYLEENNLPDVVLLDVMMPAMSGYEVCAKIREKYTLDLLPIIFLTAKNQLSNLVEGFTIGANDYLTKPFFAHELVARVSTLKTLARSTRKAQSHAEVLANTLRSTRTLNLCQKRSTAVRVACESVLNKAPSQERYAVSYCLMRTPIPGSNAAQVESFLCEKWPPSQWIWNEAREDDKAAEEICLASARKESCCSISGDSLTLVASFADKVLAAACIRGLAEEFFSQHDLDSFRLLTESLAITLHSIDLAQEARSEHTLRLQEEQRSLRRLLSMANAIHGKIGRPILALMKVFEAQQLALSSLLAKVAFGDGQNENGTRQFWKGNAGEFRRSLDELTALSQQLTEVRDEGTKMGIEK